MGQEQRGETGVRLWTAALKPNGGGGLAGVLKVTDVSARTSEMVG